MLCCESLKIWFSFLGYSKEGYGFCYVSNRIYCKRLLSNSMRYICELTEAYRCPKVAGAQGTLYNTHMCWKDFAFTVDSQDSRALYAIEVHYYLTDYTEHTINAWRWGIIIIFLFVLKISLYCFCCCFLHLLFLIISWNICYTKMNAFPKRLLIEPNT